MLRCSSLKTKYMWPVLRSCFILKLWFVMPHRWLWIAMDNQFWYMTHWAVFKRSNWSSSHLLPSSCSAHFCNLNSICCYIGATFAHFLSVEITPRWLYPPFILELFSARLPVETKFIESSQPPGLLPNELATSFVVATFLLRRRVEIGETCELGAGSFFPFVSADGESTLQMPARPSAAATLKIGKAGRMKRSSLCGRRE